MTGSHDPDRDLNDRLRDLERLLEAVDGAADGDDERLLRGLEDATADLHALLGSSLASAAREPARADLDQVVEHVLRTFVAEQPMPLVVRQFLCGRPLPVACSRDELLHAVRRALDLCVRGAAPGSTLDVATREADDDAVLVVGCDDVGPSLQERAVTLHEFAKGLHGRCTIATDQRGAVRLLLSFPLALERH